MSRLANVTAFLSRLSSRERTILYVTVVCALAFFVQRFVIAPVFSRMAELDQTIAKREQAIKDGFLILSQEDELLKKRDQYASVLSDSGSDQERITEFLKEVEALAEAAGVYLVDIKPAGQTAAVKGGPKQYVLDLNLEAKMPEVFAFFADLSREDRLIKIMRYQILPKDEKSDVAACSLSVAKLASVK